eukprot:TRINITY_DN147_c1_g1_i1.p1 TRINITY_DN147_c1_g1~~TRINITY_DN147_c1_g1_i1.p1  ORF type:complete len:1114 (-),score=253.45 TRINITY_DN147_c1_g1_i1:98-3439(-)
MENFFRRPSNARDNNTSGSSREDPGPATPVPNSSSGGSGSRTLSSNSAHSRSVALAGSSLVPAQVGGLGPCPLTPGRGSTASAQPPNSARGNASGEPEAPMTLQEMQELVRAERLWWSEASERQVKRLEVTVDTQISQASEKLADLNRLAEERLAGRLDDERQERQAALAIMRRDLDAQQVFLTELSRRPSGGPGIQGNALEAMSRLRDDFQVRVDQVRSDADAWREENRLAMQRLQQQRDQLQHMVESAEAELKDLRKDVAEQRGQASKVSMLEATVAAVRAEHGDLKDRTDHNTSAIKEQHVLLGAITDERHQQLLLTDEANSQQQRSALANAEDLKGRLEEIDRTHHEAREQATSALKQAMDTLRADQHTQITRNLEERCEDLGRRLDAERLERLKEVEEIKSNLEVSCEKAVRAVGVPTSTFEDRCHGLMASVEQERRERLDEATELRRRCETLKMKMEAEVEGMHALVDKELGKHSQALRSSSQGQSSGTDASQQIPDNALIDAALGRERAALAARGELPSQLRAELVQRVEALDSELRAELKERVATVDESLRTEIHTRVETLNADLRCEVASRFNTVQSELRSTVAFSNSLERSRDGGLSKRVEALESDVGQSIQSLQAELRRLLPGLGTQASGAGGGSLTTTAAGVPPLGPAAAGGAPEGGAERRRASLEPPLRGSATPTPVLARGVVSMPQSPRGTLGGNREQAFPLTAGKRFDPELRGRRQVSASPAPGSRQEWVADSVPGSSTPQAQQPQPHLPVSRSSRDGLKESIVSLVSKVHNALTGSASESQGSGPTRSISVPPALNSSLDGMGSRGDMPGQAKLSRPEIAASAASASRDASTPPADVAESREVFKQALQELLEENRALQQETSQIMETKGRAANGGSMQLPVGNRQEVLFSSRGPPRVGASMQLPVGGSQRTSLSKQVDERRRMLAMASGEETPQAIESRPRSPMVRGRPHSPTRIAEDAFPQMQQSAEVREPRHSMPSFSSTPAGAPPLGAARLARASVQGTPMSHLSQQQQQPQQPQLQPRSAQPLHPMQQQPHPAYGVRGLQAPGAAPAGVADASSGGMSQRGAMPFMAQGMPVGRPSSTLQQPGRVPMYHPQR